MLHQLIDTRSALLPVEAYLMTNAYNRACMLSRLAYVVDLSPGMATLLLSYNRGAKSTLDAYHNLTCERACLLIFYSFDFPVETEGL